MRAIGSWVYLSGTPTWDLQSPHIVILACFGNSMSHVCQPHQLHAFHLTQQSSLPAMRAYGFFFLQCEVLVARSHQYGRLPLRLYTCLAKWAFTVRLVFADASYKYVLGMYVLMQDHRALPDEASMPIVPKLTSQHAPSHMPPVSALPI